MRGFGDLVKILLLIHRVYLFISLVGLSFGFQKILAVGFKMGKRASIAEAFGGSIVCYFLLFYTLQVHYII